VDVSYGLTDWLNVYAAFNPYGHTHSGIPGDIESVQRNGFFPRYPNTIFPTIPFTGTPGYVEDFPFAANNKWGSRRDHGGSQIRFAFGTSRRSLQRFAAQ